MTQDVELVEHDLSLRSVRVRRWLNTLATALEVGREELFQVRLLAPRAAEPGRPLVNEVADHHPVRVSLADGDLVRPDRRGGRQRVPAPVVRPCIACPGPRPW